MGLATDNTLCEYDVTVTGPSSLGSLDVRLPVSARAGFAVVRQEKPAELTFRNLTPTGTTDPTADQRKVQVTLAHKTGTTCGVAVPSGNPYTVDAASHTTVQLGREDCVWTVSYQNLADDCIVAVEFRGHAGDVLGGNQQGTSADYGSFDITVRGRVGASTPLVAIEFTVGACATTFEAEFEVDLTDEVALPDHEGMPIELTVAPKSGSDPACSDGFSLRLTLNAAGQASATRQLADVPAGQTERCSYEVSAPAMVQSAGVGLARTSGTTIEVSSAAGAMIEFEALRPVRVALVNATDANSLHNPAQRRVVQVTLTTDDDCAQSVPAGSPYRLAAGAQATSVWGLADCEWTLSYANAAEDCRVSRPAARPGRRGSGQPR